MAITVKHLKVSTIPDAGDDTLIEPSDWNNDHVLTGTVPVANGGTGAATLTGYVKGNGTANMTAASTIPNTDVTGLGTMSTQNSNNISVTGGSITGTTVSGYIPTTEKAAALGVATLDAGGTVPLSQIPASIQGGVSYQGTWNASTNTPTLSNGVGTKGYYYVVSVAGNTNLDGITAWNVGDWAIFNGTVWQKVDNTDAVTSVNGYTGTVVLTNTDISGFGTMSTQNANSVAITGGTIDGTTIGATTTSTGKFTTLNASTSLTTPIVQATNSAGLALKNSAGSTQMSMGAGGFDNLAINVPTNINGANAQIDISPTGTGHVHIKPSGTGGVEIAPTNAGTMNNMVIGGTTPLAITGTTVTATTFVGSGASLTNVVNSLAASTGISVSGSTGAVTVTNTAPDQTVVLTGGTGISTSGTYPNFTITNTAPSSGGTVTSVAATVPSFLSVTGSPITSSGTLALSYSGTALPIANGGTGQTTANDAFNALAPSQTSNAGKYLTTNGTTTSWETVGGTTYTRTSFTATASQTTFSVTYTVGLIEVYVNGVLLNGADYTASNGTSVVLAEACSAGDIVETIAFASFSVANTVSSLSGGTTGLTPSSPSTGNVVLAGTLAVANGGTGVTTSTGSGANVLGTSPTLTSPTISGAVLSSMASSVITSDTAKASTSGTSIDFTGIPSWVKRITIMFSGVSTSGTSPPQVQIGSGSFTTTGYLSSASFLASGGTSGVSTSTTGFVMAGVSAANARTGHMVLTNITGNAWVSSTIGGFTDATATFMGGGNLTLSGTLDRIRVTTVGGTNTFDAGSINIMYE